MIQTRSYQNQKNFALGRLCRKDEKPSHRLKGKFANNVHDKGLISTIYKELSKVDNKKNQTIQLENGQKHLTKWYLQVSNEKMFTSIAIREMQSKSTVSYYRTTIRTANTKIPPQNTSESTKKPILSYAASGCVK